MNRRILLIFLVIIVLVIFVTLVFWLKDYVIVPNPSPNPDYSCNKDEDCAIKAIGCAKCSPMVACVNRNWTIKCNNLNLEKNCPPAPLWVKNCKCINSKCVDCRGDECKITPSS